MTTALLTILFLLAYFAPTFCAHPSRRASVLFVNLFAFVLCVPWFIAMYMAARNPEVYHEPLQSNSDVGRRPAPCRRAQGNDRRRRDPRSMPDCRRATRRTGRHGAGAAMNARQRRVARRARKWGTRMHIPRLTLTPAQQSALLACLQPAASRFFISQERPTGNTPAEWEALPWIEIGSGAVPNDQTGN